MAGQAGGGTRRLLPPCAWPGKIERAEAMLGAVRQARERASRAHADQVSVGAPAFACLLG